MELRLRLESYFLYLIKFDGAFVSVLQKKLQKFNLLLFQVPRDFFHIPNIHYFYGHILTWISTTVSAVVWFSFIIESMQIQVLRHAEGLVDGKNFARGRLHAEELGYIMLSLIRVSKFSADNLITPL